MMPGHASGEQLPSKSQLSQALTSAELQSGSTTPQPQWHNSPSPKKRVSQVQAAGVPVQMVLSSASMGPGHDSVEHPV